MASPAAECAAFVAGAVLVLIFLVILAWWGIVGGREEKLQVTGAKKLPPHFGPPAGKGHPLNATPLPGFGPHFGPPQVEDGRGPISMIPPSASG